MEASSSSLQKSNNENAKARRPQRSGNAGAGGQINRLSRSARRTGGSKTNRGPPPKMSTGGGVSSYVIVDPITLLQRDDTS
ncbi:unnamed protein product [Citrullus colocynthis]|uniref:Uncharacterized protein n=1 Tax=Citrullus colocynthis TaxID=252529 RepID=A0ABP0Y070_9ROSI